MLKDKNFSKYTLHIIQTKKHAEHYIKNFGKNKNDLVFPISIDALYTIEKKNLKFLNFYDLWDTNKESYYKEFYIKKINNFIYDLDSRLVKQSNKFEHIAEGFRFQLEIILGNLFFLNQFKKEILSFNFKSIICYESFILSKFIYDFRPNPRKLIFNIFVNSKNENSIKKIIFFPEFYILKEEIENILKSKLWKYVRRFFKKSKKFSGVNQSSYLLLGGEYDWPIYLDNRKILFSRISRDYKFNIKKNKYLFIKKILFDLFKKYFSFNYHFYDNFLSELIDKISFEMIYIISKKNYCIQLLNSKKAIITSCVVDPFESYLCLLFKSYGKNVILWQHGENGFVSERDILNESSELRVCNKYLAYTENIASVLENYFDKFLKIPNKPNFYAVGSVHKKPKTFLNPNLNEKILLCVGKFFGVSRFFQDLGDPDLRLYKIHKSFLKIAKRNCKKYKFEIKANNTFMFNHLPYDSNNSFNTNYKSRFIDLLNLTRAVILDTPATTLIEASCTNVPIFAIKGRSEYTNEFYEISSKRVCWCEDNMELEFKLQEFLNNGVYDANVEDKSLVESYLGNDSYEVIWEKVDKILNS
ncbi:hypothetical protein [Prochlorococcus marinus]|jgi:hypothetical protein|uniref:Uncharacterized protein n=1 Tax=Prochlorococcus marinus (strain MIT 9301) TaxID=167546 RepID=A3PE85_PROM0|nr:hypothetical protein [Prochlorococcus marinus]ABO18060.1 Hypothetical protein P9301_14371 [Prochlorococcus marinus str. MIT 9301]